MSFRNESRLVLDADRWHGEKVQLYPILAHWSTMWLQVRYSTSLRLSFLLKWFNTYCTLVMYQELCHVQGAYTTWLLKQRVPECREHTTGIVQDQVIQGGSVRYQCITEWEATLLNIFETLRFCQGEFSVLCQCAFKIFSSGLFTWTSQS